MEDTISQTRQEFTRARARMLHTLSTTPDDRLNWSPSETARTPLQQVGHAADAIKNMHETFDGRRFAAKTPADAERQFRELDRKFTNKDEVVKLFETNCTAYEAWLDALSPDQLDSMVNMPFDFGEMLMRSVIGFPAEHTLWHAAQLEYMQTIYGDWDWHM